MSYYILDPYLMDSDRRVGQSAHPQAHGRHQAQYNNPRGLFDPYQMTFYPEHVAAPQPSTGSGRVAAPTASSGRQSAQAPTSLEELLWPLMQSSNAGSGASNNTVAAPPSSFWSPSIFPKGHGQPLSMTCNFSESENDFVVTADLPGVTAKDIQVSILTHPRGGEKVLVVKAERKHRQEEGNDDADKAEGDNTPKVKKSSLYHYVETSYGMIQRTFRLPENINTDNIKCQLDHGVLTVTVNKNRRGIAASVPVNNVGGPAQQPSVDTMETVNVEDVNDDDA